MPISIAGTANAVAGLQIDILFDSDVLTLLTCVLGAAPGLQNHLLTTAMVEQFPVPPDPAVMRLGVITNLGQSQVHTFGDGTVINCTFHVSSVAPVNQSYELDGDKQQVFDASGNTVPSTVQDGSIDVACGGCGCS